MKTVSFQGKNVLVGLILDSDALLCVQVLPFYIRRAQAMKLYGLALKASMKQNGDGTPNRVNDDRNILVSNISFIFRCYRRVTSALSLSFDLRLNCKVCLFSFVCDELLHRVVTCSSLSQCCYHKLS